MQGATLNLPAVRLGRHHCPTHPQLPRSAKLRPASSQQPLNFAPSTALLACASHRRSKKLHLTQLRLTQPDTLSRQTTNIHKPQSLQHDASMVCPCGDNKLPTGLGIWSQHGARSNTQLARSPSGTPPLWTYTMKPRCPTHGGLLRIRSHASTTSMLRKATPSQHPATT